ncbi:MAG: SGNH/GDSL hydrolase family protein [Mangrovibacterium sp.]
MQLSRRSFILNGAARLAGVAAIPMIMSAALPAGKKRKPAGNVFPQRGVLLFQGDSITDAGRDRKKQLPNDAGSFGGGYALMAAASLLADLPGKNLSIYNRGISGNKVFQLAERWQEDCLELKPDVLSILIGVNDYWHRRNGNYDGTEEVYENDFRALLKRTREALPETCLVICEPYSVDGGTAVEAGWQEEFEPYRKAAMALAKEFDTLYVPFHSLFREALKHAPAAYWSPDGVHPSMAGAQLMARAWLKVVVQS